MSALPMEAVQDGGSSQIGSVSQPGNNFSIPLNSVSALSGAGNSYNMTTMDQNNVQKGTHFGHAPFTGAKAYGGGEEMAGSSNSDFSNQQGYFSAPYGQPNRAGYPNGQKVAPMGGPVQQSGGAMFPMSGPTIQQQVGPTPTLNQLLTQKHDVSEIPPQKPMQKPQGHSEGQGWSNMYPQSSPGMNQITQNQGPNFDARRQQQSATYMQQQQQSLRGPMPGGHNSLYSTQGPGPGPGGGPGGGPLRVPPATGVAMYGRGFPQQMQQGSGGGGAPSPYPQNHPGTPYSHAQQQQQQYGAVVNQDDSMTGQQPTTPSAPSSSGGTSSNCSSGPTAPSQQQPQPQSSSMPPPQPVRTIPASPGGSSSSRSNTPASVNDNSMPPPRGLSQQSTTVDVQNSSGQMPPPSPYGGGRMGSNQLQPQQQHPGMTQQAQQQANSAMQHQQQQQQPVSMQQMHPQGMQPHPGLIQHPGMQPQPGMQQQQQQGMSMQAQSPYNPMFRQPHPLYTGASFQNQPTPGSMFPGGVPKRAPSVPMASAGGPMEASVPYTGYSNGSGAGGQYPPMMQQPHAGGPGGPGPGGATPVAGPSQATDQAAKGAYMAAQAAVVAAGNQRQINQPKTPQGMPNSMGGGMPLSEGTPSIQPPSTPGAGGGMDTPGGSSTGVLTPTGTPTPGSAGGGGAAARKRPRGQASSRPATPGSAGIGRPGSVDGAQGGGPAGKPAGPAAPSTTLASNDILFKQLRLGEEQERCPMLERLSAFMGERGAPISSIPNIGKQPVDLYKFYAAVRDRGGFEPVCRKKLWKEVGSVISVGASSNAAYTLKKAYIRCLLPYECNFDRGGIDPQAVIKAVDPKKEKASASSSSTNARYASSPAQPPPGMSQQPGMGHPHDPNAMWGQHPGMGQMGGRVHPGMVGSMGMNHPQGPPGMGVPIGMGGPVSMNHHGVGQQGGPGMGVHHGGPGMHPNMGMGGGVNHQQQQGRLGVGMGGMIRPPMPGMPQQGMTQQQIIQQRSFPDGVMKPGIDGSGMLNQSGGGMMSASSQMGSGAQMGMPQGMVNGMPSHQQGAGMPDQPIHMSGYPVSSAQQSAQQSLGGMGPGDAEHMKMQQQMVRPGGMTPYGQQPGQFRQQNSMGMRFPAPQHQGMSVPQQQAMGIPQPVMGVVSEERRQQMGALGMTHPMGGGIRPGMPSAHHGMLPQGMPQGPQSMGPSQQGLESSDSGGGGQMGGPGIQPAQMGMGPIGSGGPGGLSGGIPGVQQGHSTHPGGGYIGIAPQYNRDSSLAPPQQPSGHVSSPGLPHMRAPPAQGPTPSSGATPGESGTSNFKQPPSKRPHRSKAQLEKLQKEKEQKDNHHHQQQRGQMVQRENNENSSFGSGMWGSSIGPIPSGSQHPPKQRSSRPHPPSYMSGAGKSALPALLEAQAPGMPSPYPQRHHMPPPKSLTVPKIPDFPAGCVEVTQSVTVKRKTITSKQLAGSVDLWRVVMSLQSGLLAESTWALDVLNILLHDDTSVIYFSLDTLPSLLDQILNHYRKVLKSLFTKELADFDKPTITTEDCAPSDQSASGPESLGNAASLSKLVKNGVDYTWRSRHGKTVGSVEKAIPLALQKDAALIRAAIGTTDDDENDTSTFSQFDQYQRHITSEFTQMDDVAGSKKQFFGGGSVGDQFVEYLKAVPPCTVFKKCSVVTTSEMPSNKSSKQPGSGKSAECSAQCSTSSEFNSSESISSNCGIENGLPSSQAEPKVVVPNGQDETLMSVSSCIPVSKSSKSKKGLKQRPTVSEVTEELLNENTTSRDSLPVENGVSSSASEKSADEGTEEKMDVDDAKPSVAESSGMGNGAASSEQSDAKTGNLCAGGNEKQVQAAPSEQAPAKASHVEVRFAELAKEERRRAMYRHDRLAERIESFPEPRDPSSDLFTAVTDSQEELLARATVLSNIVRSLSFVPKNDKYMANCGPLLALLGQLITLRVDMTGTGHSKRTYYSAAKGMCENNDGDSDHVDSDSDDDGYCEGLFAEGVISDKKRKESTSKCLSGSLLQSGQRKRRHSLLDYQHEDGTDLASQTHRGALDDMLASLREDALIVLTNLTVQLDLTPYPESTCRPIFEGLLFWLTTPSAAARDPSITTPGGLSARRLALESISKLCAHPGNIDLLLATPATCRRSSVHTTAPTHLLPRLYRIAVDLLADHRPNGMDTPGMARGGSGGSQYTPPQPEAVLQEFSIVLVAGLSMAGPEAARGLAASGPCISRLLAFLERAESNAYSVAQQKGIAALRDNPETMGTSLDMIRRTAAVLCKMAAVPENLDLFRAEEERLLRLVMSQILDQHVAKMLSEVLYLCGEVRETKSGRPTSLGL